MSVSASQKSRNFRKSADTITWRYYSAHCPPIYKRTLLYLKISKASSVCLAWNRTVLYSYIRFILYLKESTNCFQEQTNHWTWYIEIITDCENYEECINPYPTAFPYGNGMVLHFYQQQESSTTKTVHKVINKGLKTYV